MPDKTVLITGASRGIGLAIAHKFAKESYRVAINSARSQEALHAAAESLRQTNPLVMAVPADVSDYAQAAGMFAQVQAQLGPVDILINNAGRAQIKLFQDTSPAEWDCLLRNNLYTVMNCTHLAIPHMIRQKHGAIVNLSSIWGMAGASCETLYSAAKGGVNLFTKALAKELGPCAVRVNAIACGVIDTDMNRQLDAHEKTALIGEIPFMRFGKPEEIANLAYFLSSEDAAYITGQIIAADGAFL